MPRPGVLVATVALLAGCGRDPILEAAERADAEKAAAAEKQGPRTESPDRKPVPTVEPPHRGACQLPVPTLRMGAALREAGLPTDCLSPP